MPRAAKRKSASNEETVAAAPAVSKRPKRGVAIKAPEPDLEVFYDADWEGVGKANTNGLPPAFKLIGPGLKGSQKIAGFDLDYTLVRPKSGRKFPSGASDWMFLYDEVPKKLEELHKDGYKILIVTNQRGMEKGHTKPTDIQRKINQIANHLQIPIQCFIASGENYLRKPGTRLWDMMVNTANDGVKPDMSKCMYVGDAAGRAKEWAPGKPRDFSCSDRMFAANVGIAFHTPEAFFLGETEAPFKWHSIDPAAVLKEADTTGPQPQYHKPKGSKDMVIMVGPPASGKSTLAKKHLVANGYTWVNRDTLNTPAKCLKAAKEAVKAGENIVIDNTNPTQAARGDYLDLADRKGYTARCIVLTTPRELAFHMNMFRQSQSEGGVRRIPEVAYNVFRKNFQAPDESEGFTEIIEVPFKPTFKSDKDKKLFLQWTDM